MHCRLNFPVLPDMSFKRYQHTDGTCIWMVVMYSVMLLPILTEYAAVNLAMPSLPEIDRLDARTNQELRSHGLTYQLERLGLLLLPCNTFACRERKAHTYRYSG